MRSKQTLTITLIVLMFALAVVLRVFGIPHQNLDTRDYYKWYSQFEQRGLAALADDFSVYTPPYLEMLWLASLVRGVIDPQVSIKLIPILFDLLSAFAVYKLVRLKFPEGPVPWLASAGFLLLPTVLANSAYWGQTDSLYTSFLLLGLYFLLKERPVPAMLMMGIALTIKAQAVFLLPFLAVMFFKKRIPFWTFFILPVVYGLGILPAILAGRPVLETLSIYGSQVENYPQIAMHAANLYSLLVGHPRWVLVIYYGGIVMALLVVGAWVLYYAYRRFTLNSKMILFTALMSSVLVPFLLPKMHDRYFYPADNISYVLAFFWPGAWYIALGYQVISGLVYFIFLNSVGDTQNRLLLTISVLLNTIMVAHLIIRQWLETRADKEQ